jgi:hypothetical protein
MRTSSISQEARDWSRELFESRPSLLVVIVIYNPWAKQRKGRRNKPGVVSIQHDVIAALKNGNVERAKQLAVSVSTSPDSGLALCENQEALAKVLAERIRRREYCYVDDDLHDSVLMLTVWRE